MKKTKKFKKYRNKSLNCRKTRKYPFNRKKLQLAFHNLTLKHTKRRNKNIAAR